ncbi:type III restriction endonuclease subunit M [Malacoplasma penetrans]|uniref:type III restriction endonuclease subunit M n=1 Tax=Malacoplasma penetrans TaxID=28227 RepID=UPI001012C0A4|nr:type III restriction endonuclease subunit M [Malacoplasma penetrans]RXY97264.1 type III restriction endonuclease subunit M [Malacoplasma penetrans]
MERKISELKLSYINKINNQPSASFNKDQKEIAIKIIEKANDEDLDNIYKLLNMRIKTGFVFDLSPNENRKSISWLKYNKELSINDKKANNYYEYDDDNLTNSNLLIIGENYDALNNLLLTHRGMVDIIYGDPPL